MLYFFLQQIHFLHDLKNCHELFQNVLIVKYTVSAEMILH